MLCNLVISRVNAGCCKTDAGGTSSECDAVNADEAQCTNNGNDDVDDGTGVTFCKWDTQGSTPDRCKSICPGVEPCDNAHSIFPNQGWRDFYICILQNLFSQIFFSQK